MGIVKKAVTELNWRPHTQKPDTDEVFTAMLAIVVQHDGDDEYLVLSGFYLWQQGAFRHEHTGKFPGGRFFWWCPESEIELTVPYKNSSDGNGLLQCATQSPSHRAGLVPKKPSKPYPAKPTKGLT